MARQLSPLTVMASLYSFSKKNGPIMPVGQNPHQTVIRFGCVDFSMYVCRFSVPLMRQFCLFTYPLRSKASSVKMFSIVQASTQPYSFGGRIKLIICQMRHELSVAIHAIRTGFKKTLDNGTYIYQKYEGVD